MRWVYSAGAVPRASRRKAQTYTREPCLRIAAFPVSTLKVLRPFLESMSPLTTRLPVLNHKELGGLGFGSSL